VKFSQSNTIGLTFGSKSVDEQYSQIINRNLGLFTEEEQAKLRRTNIAVAGLGGVGGLLAERLIRLGVGSLKITDPGTYEASNLNRQFSSNTRNIGQLKVASVFNQIKEINPEAGINWSSGGIKTAEDADFFVEGSDLVIDEMDFGAWKESVFLQRAARKRGLYYLFTSALGFGALAVIFQPNGVTLEEFNRLPGDFSLKGSETPRVPRERILPEVPSYANAALSNGMIQEITEGKRPVPTCSIGVGLASMLAAAEAMNIILRRREIICAPGYIYVDLLDRRFVTGIIP
jgi:molybdopterin/thiamine biosynthesis adenylyltransferase